MSGAQGTLPQKTVRDTCLNVVQNMLQAIVPPTTQLIGGVSTVTVETPYNFGFSSVVIGAIGKPDERKAFMAGVVPGREEKQDMYPLTECKLDVSVEFQATRNAGS